MSDKYYLMVNGVINILTILPIILILWLFLISYVVDKFKEWF